jgi:hypothetical protein
MADLQASSLSDHRRQSDALHRAMAHIKRHPFFQAMEDIDPRKQGYYQELRCAIVEVFDSLPKNVREIANDWQIDILVLAHMQIKGTSELDMFLYAKQQADTAAKKERDYIDGCLEL